uniref:Odorant binding protein n=1 Tax=Athetis dissimilis TaxID=1737331 RepID=A0A4D6Q7G5_ATHDI|nr:odorant binding protein [Athetis dissimilis]
MKSFVVLCVMAVAGIQAVDVPLSPVRQEKAKIIVAKCMKESGVSKAVLADALKENLAEDEGLKKFTFCFFREAGVVDGQGVLKVDAALAKLPPGVDKANAKSVLEGCKSKTGKDAAEKVFEMYKCYHKGVANHVLFVGVDI